MLIQIPINNNKPIIIWLIDVLLYSEAISVISPSDQALANKGFTICKMDLAGISINEAIKKGGSTIKDFKNTLGNEGKFQDEFRVYERDNSNCRRKSCNGVIKKKFISNRSTYFCNVCQK